DRQGPVRRRYHDPRRGSRRHGGGASGPAAQGSGSGAGRPQGRPVRYLPRVPRGDRQVATQGDALRHALRGVPGAARRAQARRVVSSETDRQGPGDRRHMTSVFRTIALMIVLVAVVAGCQSATGKSAGTNIDDATITASVKSKLVADKASNLTRVDVDTNNGTVYLNGTVESAEQKSRAEQLAWQASGVKTVVNNLQLKKR